MSRHIRGTCNEKGTPTDVDVPSDEAESLQLGRLRVIGPAEHRPYFLNCSKFFAVAVFIVSNVCLATFVESSKSSFV